MLSFSRTYFAVFRKLSPTLSARITEGLNKRTGKFSKNLLAYCEKTMHMGVYGTKNLCLPTSFENLNLCSDFSPKKIGECACACVCERVRVCVRESLCVCLRRGVLIGAGEGVGDSEILI